MSSTTKNIKKKNNKIGRKEWTHNIVKSHNPSWETHKLKNNYIAEIFHKEWVLRTLHQSPQSGGSWTGKMSLQSIGVWRQVEFFYKNLTGLGKIDTLLLKGANKISHAPGPKAKVVIF